MIERQRHDSDAGGAAPAAPGGSTGLTAARAAGTRLLDAAAEAIDVALSGNSQQFLSAIRQHGGQ